MIAILAGMLSDRYSIKQVGGISLALMVIGPILVVLSDAYAYLLLGRVNTGVGSKAVSAVLYQLLAP